MTLRDVVVQGPGGRFACEGRGKRRGDHLRGRCVEESGITNWGFGLECL